MRSPKLSNKDKEDLKYSVQTFGLKGVIIIFKVFVKDVYNVVVKVYEDCFKISVVPESDMEMKHIDVLEAYGVRCPYFLIVDGTGAHFYPLFYYSAEVG